MTQAVQVTNQKSRSELQNDVAEQINEKYHFVCLEDTQELLVYEDGIYTRNGEKVVAQEVDKAFNGEATKQDFNEIVWKIKVRNFKPRSVFDVSPNLVCLKNGVFDLDTGQFKPTMWEENGKLEYLHLWDMYFLTKIPVYYDPDIKCPSINVFFSRVLPNENSRNTFFEILGYCLYRRYFLHNWFIFYGNGNNGKSVAGNVTRKFLGEENTSAKTVYEICTSKFASSQLFGKMANISVEMPLKGKNKSISLEEIKSLTGEDKKSAEKKFQNSFDFVNCAKIMSICNKVGIELREEDDIFALWHRLCVIEFPVIIPKSEQDPFLIDKLTTPQELSGLLNKALEGFQRLRKNGKFSNEKDWELKRDEYIMISDPAKAFIDRELEEDENFDVATEDVYLAYKEFCETHGKPAIAKNAFSSKMNTYLKTYVSNANRNQKRFKIYVGIKLKNNPEKNLEKDFTQSKLGDNSAFS